MNIKSKLLIIKILKVQNVSAPPLSVTLSQPTPLVEAYHLLETEQISIKLLQGQRRNKGFKDLLEFGETGCTIYPN